MFDAIVNALARQFALGENARPFLQMLLARIDDPARGGLSGFIERLRTGGMGDDVNDWIASPGGEAPVEAQDLEPAMGDDTLVPEMAARFGLHHKTVLAALAYAVPAVIRQVAGGGAIPPRLPPEADGFIGNRAEWASRGAASTVQRVEPAPAPKRNWLPWVLAAVIAALLLGYCSTRDRDEPAAPAPVADATAPAPVPATPEVVAEAPEPAGAGIVATPAGVVPVLKVYFDTGKAEVAADFTAKSAGMVEYMKGNTITIAVISGFNDPTGDPAANALLAKQRAEAVQQALVSAGVPKERTVLEKPAETGTGATSTASRRVDVVIRE